MISRTANARSGLARRGASRPSRKLPSPRPTKKAVSAAAAAGAVAPISTEKRRIHRTWYASAAAPDRKNSEWSASRRLAANRRRRRGRRFEQDPVDQRTQLRRVCRALNAGGDLPLLIHDYRRRETGADLERFHVIEGHLEPDRKLDVEV